MPKTDTSMLPFGKAKRVEDTAYRKSAAGRSCENCDGRRPGCSLDTVVGAHPRATLAGGTGFKPDDRLLLFLGKACHDEQENGGVLWLAQHLFKRLRLAWPEQDLPTEMEAYWLVRHILHPLLIRRYELWNRQRSGRSD